jgi:hypothetical protein
MRLNILGALVAVVVLTPPPAVAAVTVTIANGNVSVSAQDATIRQILTEWARVGQTRIVNIERVSGPPMSIELTNVPEAQALDTLLRTVSGYLAAARPVVVPNASTYDRIFILPTSTGTPARPVAAAATPAFAPPPLVPPPQDDQSADDEPPQQRVSPVQANAPRGPGFNTFPRPPVQQQQQQQQQQQPAAVPQDMQAPASTSPAGVSTPGMVVPTPQQPGQAPNPGQPQNTGQPPSPGQAPNPGSVR